ncbi:hypothetical protein MEO93_27765 [Dolichospermum sp. ST_sed3]|nr:hypothetical protein [Dolichospermum sp. ST_sed3]
MKTIKLNEFKSIIKKLVKEHVEKSDKLLKEEITTSYKGRKILTFQNVEEFQNWIRQKQRTPDWVIVGGTVYTMDNYDSEGSEITYGNVTESKMLVVKTENRYGILGFSDAVVEEDVLGGYRNDMSYLDKEEEQGKEWEKMTYPDRPTEEIDETKDVNAMYRKAGMTPPKGKGIHTKKFHKCVTDVGAKGDIDNPFAVCMSKLGRDKSVKSSHRRED